MLNIKIDVIERVKHKASVRLMRLQISRKIETNQNSKKTKTILFLENVKVVRRFWDVTRRNVCRWWVSLRVLRAGTWSTVYRTIAIRKQLKKKKTEGQHTSWQRSARWSRKKPKGNVIELITNIYMDVLICRSRNAIARPMRSHIFKQIDRIENFKEKFKKWEALYECSVQKPGWRFTARLHTLAVGQEMKTEPAKNVQHCLKLVELTRSCSIT